MQPRSQVLPEEISIALHRAVADKLREHPELLEIARKRVDGWFDGGSVPTWYAERWRELLASNALEIAEAIVRRDETMSALRQVSPFAGIIDPRARWRLRREVRARFSA